MTYRVRYDKRFMRQLEALPGDVRAVARRLVHSLTDNPRPSRAKELEGHSNHYRIWLPRDCRLVYGVLDEENLVDLLYVGPKHPDLYEKLGLGRVK
jgi:mRNA-degrading endonuclease RelE of RelBE toxin-antitoxin system